MWRWFGSTKQHSGDSTSRSTDVDALRQSYLDLQARILELREKDILPLREHVSALDRNWWRISLVSGVIVLILTLLGIKTYGDLQQLIKDSFKQQLEKSFGYYDKLMRARTLTNDGKYNLAESIYRDLAEARPEDEIVFIGLTDSLIRQDASEAAAQVVEKAEQSGTFPRKFQMPLSFNNAGWALLARDIDQPSKLNKAYRYLKHAEDLAARDNDPELAYPLANLAVYYFALGEVSKAQAYVSRWRQIDRSPWREPADENWYRRLSQSKPERATEMKDLFNTGAQGSTSPSPTQTVGSQATAP